MLEKSQDPQSGAFSYVSNEEGVGNPFRVIPGHTANMVGSLIRFGYLDDERAQKAIAWLIKHQRFDDGPEAPEWPYHL